MRAALSLDCCDYEVISWSATTGNISTGSGCRTAGIKIYERSGNSLYLPDAINWLTDEGCYLADSTRTFAASLIGPYRVHDDACMHPTKQRDGGIVCKSVQGVS